MTRAPHLQRILGSLVVIMAVMAVSHLSPTAYAAGGGSQDDEKESNRSVELNAMVFPVIVDGKLVNYLFVNARMQVADGKSIWKYREQAHVIRDAVLRATHRKSVHLKGDGMRIDEALAAKVCIEAANEILEEDAMVSMTFQQVASQKPAL